MKALIFDSSSIITLSLTGFIDILEPLKRYSKIRFLITPQVKNEVVDTPLRIKRFELEALRISGLIKRGILELVQTPELEDETEKVMSITNNLFSAKGQAINILHKGEASCLALSKLLKNDTILAIDERTTRMLCENPKNLHKLMELKLHLKIERDSKMLKELEVYSVNPIIRSSEIIIAAYKKNMISLPGDTQTVMDALMFATKFKGNAISYKEIEEAKKIKI